MKKNIFFGLCTCVSMMACADENILEVEGRLYMKGSSVHTYLVLEDDTKHKIYKIQNKNSFGLIQKQKQHLKLKVKFLKKAIDPGFPAVVEVVEILQYH